MDGTKVFTDPLEKSFLFSNDFLKNVLLILSVVLLTVYIQRRKKVLPNFPSGPRGIPIFGYIPFLGSINPYLKLHQLGKKYGGMFSLQLGNKKVLVLASFSSIKEAFSKGAFLGRPDTGNFRITDNHHTGYIDLNGEIWKEQRLFCQNILQTLGATSAGLETLLSEEISHIFDILNDQNGQPVLIAPLLHSSACNQLSTLLYGKRYDYSDPMRHRIDKSLLSIGVSSRILAIFNCLLFGKLLLRLSSTFMEGVRSRFFLYDHFRQKVAHNEAKLEENNLNNFTDYYLSAIKKNGEDSSPTYTREALLGNLWQYLAAGSATTTDSLHWLLLTMAKFPEVQKRVRKEINDVIGNERAPTWNDRYQMPYTQAVLAEMQRWRTIVPTDIFKATTEDTTLRGFNIPKGTLVLALLHSAHYDTDYWVDPETFRPERFLSEDGKTLLAKEAFVPFSFGRRACPGKKVALIAIFFYFTSFLQKFQVQPEDKDIDLEGSLLTTLKAKSQKLIFRAHDDLTV